MINEHDIKDMRDVDYCPDCGEPVDECICEFDFDAADYFVACPDHIPEHLYFEGLEVTGDHDLAISYAEDLMKDG